MDHGKTTLVQALTGTWASRHSEELKRGITIKLGYADASIYKCPNCDEPQCYCSTKDCPVCGGEAELQRTVSFVDAPGHEILMATMLSGAAVMDGAILVIAADEPCPQPQTREHLAAIEAVGLKNLVIVQNKIDLVSMDRALKNYDEIKKFIKGSIAEDAPIIPVSAQQIVNIDLLIQAMQKYLPTPTRDPDLPAMMHIIRSFDVNKPGTPIDKIKGGVLGGSLVQGKLSVGDQVEIRPGVSTKGETKPIKTKITGLQKAKKDQKEVTPGGLLGVSTHLDPFLTKADAMSGSVVGLPEKLPPVWNEVNLEIHMLDRVVGSKQELNVDPILEGSPVMITVGTSRTVGTITEKGKVSKVKLKLPICAEKGERVALSRQVMSRWRLIGWGEIC